MRQQDLLLETMYRMMKELNQKVESLQQQTDKFEERDLQEDLQETQRTTTYDAALTKQLLEIAEKLKHIETRIEDVEMNQLDKLMQPEKPLIEKVFGPMDMPATARTLPAPPKPGFPKTL